MFVGLGCGPVQYLTQVSHKAAVALEQAERLQADRRAPYHFTKAREYYLKAQEEGGESSFQSAIEYGRRSQELAHEASRIAREQLAAERAKPAVLEAKP